MTVALTEIARLGIARLVERQCAMYEHHLTTPPAITGFENAVPLAVLGESMPRGNATLTQSSPVLELHGSFLDLPLAA